MADLVVGMAKTVVEGVVTKAQAAVEQEAKLRQSAQRDLVFITGEFQMMQAFLQVANAERVENPVVMTWVRQIRDLAYDVEDCIEFVVHLDKKSSWWWRMIPSWCLARRLPLDEAVDQIQELKARVEDVSTRNTRYSLISDTGSKPTVVQQQPAASFGATAFNMLVAPTETAKRQRGDLTHLLTKSARDLQVISVCGTGGNIGIASIIWKAYNDQETRQNFNCRAWVKITHPFNPKEFVRCLIAEFHASSSSQEPQGPISASYVEKRMEANQGDHLEFVRQVNTKRYLVVLEDLSTMAEWGAIRTFFPNIQNRSRIILSTQQFEVASLSVGNSYQVWNLHQFSAEHSVYAFFQEGSQDDDKGDVAENGSSSTDDTKWKAILDSKKANASTLVESAVPENELTPTLIGSAVLEIGSAVTEIKSAVPKKEFTPTFIGRDIEMIELRQYLIKSRYKVMSVWGIAGVGKSALIRNLFCDRILYSEANIFNKYGWVDVTHPLNLRDFSRSLLWNIHSKSVDTTENEYHFMMRNNNPIQECQDLLKEGNCLIVIDDVQSKQEWDLIQDYLVPGSSNNVILVITTEASIATYCADKEEFVFNVKSLKANAASSLFKKVSGRSSFPIGREAELQELIWKCGGLPKIILAVGSVLSTKTVAWMETARSINLSFIEELETNRGCESLQDLLSWMGSYFRLCPDFLKPCIFYLSLFPRDRSIRRRRLVRRWIAEGYARDSEDKSAEQNGEAFFNHLLSLSIIQQPPEKAVTTALGQTRMVWCQVNGFIREYYGRAQKTEDRNRNRKDRDRKPN